MHRTLKMTLVKTMLEFDILKPQYVDAIYKISKESIPQGWSLDAFYKDLKREGSFYSIAIIDGMPVGFAGIQKVLDEADLTNIAVDKNYRNTGIATVLLKQIFDYCVQNSVKSINLEVRETNTAAIKLYLKMGFKECGIRKRYYSNTGEAAILMIKQI